MRHALVVLAALALSTGAYAEEPQRILPDASLSLGVGQTERFKFQSNFKTIIVSSEGIVRATAQSDRLMTLVGQAEGQTLLTVLGADGEQIYSANVMVTQEPGHIVKIYGHNGVKDYVGFYCTATACGRADKELNGARDVSSVTTVSPGGTAITRTFGR